MLLLTNLMLLIGGWLGWWQGIAWSQGLLNPLYQRSTFSHPGHRMQTIQFMPYFIIATLLWNILNWNLCYMVAELTNLSHLYFTVSGCTFIYRTVGQMCIKFKQTWGDIDWFPCVFLWHLMRSSCSPCHVTLPLPYSPQWLMQKSEKPFENAKFTWEGHYLWLWSSIAYPSLAIHRWQRLAFYTASSCPPLSCPCALNIILI
jgi:hypothetical protein